MFSLLLPGHPLWLWMRRKEVVGVTQNQDISCPACLLCPSEPLLHPSTSPGPFLLLWLSTQDIFSSQHIPMPFSSSLPHQHTSMVGTKFLPSPVSKKQHPTEKEDKHTVMLSPKCSQRHAVPCPCSLPLCLLALGFPCRSRSPLLLHGGFPSLAASNICACQKDA